MKEYHIIEKTYTHSKYNRKVDIMDFDIGLVRTQTPMTIDKHFHICINQVPLQDRTPLTVLGFGETEMGDTSELNYLSINYRKQLENCDNNTAVVAGRSLCFTGVLQGHVDFGDSGGPAFMEGGSIGCTHTMIAVMIAKSEEKTGEVKHMIGTNLLAFSDWLTSFTKTEDARYGAAVFPVEIDADGFVRKA